MTIQTILQQKLIEALTATGVEFPQGFKAQVAIASDLRHGDYQTNAAMMLGKRLRMNPREFAQQVIDKLDLADLASVELAGGGFINFRVLPAAWSLKLAELVSDPRLGVPATETPENIICDFSAPNVAKPMHVGHIRSTIIGDSLAKISHFLGHNVITDNHIGDWGTQFGMVIYGWKNLLDKTALEEAPLKELLRIYQTVNKLCKEDEANRKQCTDELVKLQQGDAENLAIWHQCVDVSKDGLHAIYDRLDVSFDHWLGESYYNDKLQALTESLEAAGDAKDSDGALCVFSAETLPPKQDPFKTKIDGQWEDFPMIVRKSDGAFNYATTDIATVDYRLKEWNANRIWYVVDDRQSLHFNQLIDLSKRRGCEADLVHVKFGTILGKDGTPLKTRDGNLPQLEDVLNDAVAAAAVAIEEKSPDLPAEEKAELAEAIGIGSVKFTELSHNRNSDYKFELDKMVALNGDTAPYLQNSYVRCESIFRKLDEEIDFEAITPTITEEGEVSLVRLVARYGEVLPTVLDDLRPNLLANYLLELARGFHSFYEACPVLKSSGETRLTRLAICEITRRTLSHGLSLLGIKTPSRM